MRTLGRFATGKNILILLALFLLANFVAVPLVYPKFQTLDMLNGYTPAQANQLIASYGQQGRQAYAIVEATLDLAYPFVSGMLFSLLTLYTFQRGFPNQKWAQWLALLPLAVMLSDYLENVCVLVLLLGYPHELNTVAGVANIFTTTKMILSPFELLFVLGFIGWFFRLIWIKLKA